ncbi:MAG: biopolymer transporter ExbD [Thermodesulfobacteriota bacterium]
MDIPVRPRAPGLNLTPMIDIVFLLLVFFLLTTHFVEEGGVGLRLPTAESQTERPEEPVTVSVARDGSVYLGTEAVTLVGLVERLRVEVGPGGRPVVVRGDREAPLQAAVAVLDAARAAGAVRLVVATEHGGP